jgi:hypothetical protein
LKIVIEKLKLREDEYSLPPTPFTGRPGADADVELDDELDELDELDKLNASGYRMRFNCVNPCLYLMSN